MKFIWIIGSIFIFLFLFLFSSPLKAVTDKEKETAAEKLNEQFLREEEQEKREEEQEEQEKKNTSNNPNKLHWIAIIKRGFILILLQGFAESFLRLFELLDYPQRSKLFLFLQFLLWLY